MRKTICEITLNYEHGYAVAIETGEGNIVPLETYPTEEALEKGYLEWKKFAERRGLDEPARVMFVDSNNRPASYSISEGNFIFTNSELVGRLIAN